MHTTLTYIAAALYLLSVAALIQPLLRAGAKTQKPRRYVLIPLLPALALHAYSLYNQLFTPAGLNMAFFNALSLAAAFAAGLYLILMLRHRVDNLGLAILPVTATAVIAAALGQAHETPLLFAVNSPIQAHILLSILAYSAFSIAAIQAIVLRIQDQQLHNHRPGLLTRALPPLQLMEELLFSLISVGFVLLSLGLLSGTLFLNDILGQHLVHKTVFSIIAWTVFATLLWGRHQFGWRGRKVINWTLGGFVLLVLAYFGTKLVLEFILT